MTDAPAPDADAASAPPPRRRRWPWIVGALLLGGPLAVVLVSVIYLRHVPYAIPADYAAPAPPAEPAGGLQGRWLGVSGFELTDGQTRLVLDPALTRPHVTRLIRGPIGADEALLDAHLTGPVDFILVNHAHYDHAIDAPALALRTGATVVGSPSTINLCRSRGVPEDRLIEVAGGERLTLGTFTVDVRATDHSPVMGRENPMPGVIPADAGDLWYWNYTQDGCRIYRLEAAGTSVWFHPTSMYETGELGGLRAETLIMGVSGAALTSQTMEILAEAQPARVIPTHYDNFFQPLADGLALLPMLDMPATLQLFREADPDAEVWLLDYFQTFHLPPDPGEDSQ